MELSFQLNLTDTKIYNDNPRQTHAGILAQYSAQVEKNNSLLEGTLEDAITTAIPFRPCFAEPGMSGSLIFAPAPPNMRLGDTFGKEGGTYVITVKPELAKHFLGGSVASIKKKNKKKKKKNTKGRGEIEDDSAANLKTMDESVDLTDDDDCNVASDAQVQSPSDNQVHSDVKRMLEEMQKMKQKIEDDRRATDAKWEAILQDERRGTDAILQDERRATDAKLQALAAELENERKERKEMETKAEEERKKAAAEVEALQNEIDAVKETVDDTADWIVAGCPPDSEVLYRLKLRNLLDRVQARLAYFVGLATHPYERYSSLRWRQNLQGSTTPQRAAYARSLLQEILPTQSESVKSALNNLIASNEAMNMAVEIKSNIRSGGDWVAHHDLTKPQFVAVVDEYCLKQKKPQSKDGLTKFIEFLFS